ncbi:citrate synthase like protein [Zymoseptoria brevis]|uniref:Citrate synthase n=1 Tax=Zymoseptoria brevis TaxID=1047168 RepID=A0A0F4GA72_9PEZI|nr:citrate synthase like protein [Zymoseptoria brevis]
MSDFLQVLDSRTGEKYDVPVSDNFVLAADLAQIKGPVSGGKKQQKSGPENLQKLRILDVGFQHTACKQSSITLINGEEGDLRFRGHRIQDLFHKHNYQETIFLLIWGHLPTKEEAQHFSDSLAAVASPPKVVLDAVHALPHETDVYSLFLTALSAYVGADKQMITSRHKAESTYHNNMHNTDAALIRAIAYVTTATAVAYCHKYKLPIGEPKSTGTLVENYLRMIGRPDPTGSIARSIDKLWIIYADHEMSNSTAAFLHVASTLTDPLSCVIAMAAAGSGPLHVGALELCYEGLELLGTVDNVPAYLEAVKAKQFRLYGYGHRVYKAKDPRATLIEELMQEHKAAIQANPLLQIAVEIERQANTDPYFVDRNLKMNADFYGCFIYTALDIPKDIIPALLVASRCGGAMAHWREAMQSPIKIWRPIQQYKL